MTDEFVRPGPSSIRAGMAVGGIVVHIYGVPNGNLLHVARLPDGTSADDVIRDCDVAADRTGEYPAVCIVVYDGDTGDRLRWPQGEGIFTT